MLYSSSWKGVYLFRTLGSSWNNDLSKEIYVEVLKIQVHIFQGGCVQETVLRSGGASQQNKTAHKRERQDTQIERRKGVAIRTGLGMMWRREPRAKEWKWFLETRQGIRFSHRTLRSNTAQQTSGLLISRIAGWQICVVLNPEVWTFEEDPSTACT